VQSNDTNPQIDECLSERDAAAVLAITRRGLEQLRRRGEAPPHVRVGRLIRYRRASITEWLASREVERD